MRPLFWADFSSGVNKLPTNIAINGTTVSPSLRCEGKDATASSWTCTGGTLSIAGSGADPIFDEPTPFTDSTKGVEFRASKYYQATSSSDIIASKDVIIEVVFRPRATAAAFTHVFGTKYAYISYRLAGTIWATIWDGTNASQPSSGTIHTDQWVHVIAFFDRDYSSGAVLYVNGASGTAVDPTAVLAIPADSFKAAGGNGGSLDGNIAYAAIYVGDNILDGTTSTPASIAKDRFERLTGINDLVADAAVTSSRGSTATVAIKDSTCSTTDLFTVGYGWMRTDCICDANGDRMCGIRMEPAETNVALYSEQADDSSWSTTAVVTANAATDPFGNSNADHIVATADSHLQTVTVTASVAYTCSIYLKAASSITVPVQCDDTTTNCSVGTSWTRCSSTDTSTSSTSISIGLASGTYEVDWFGYQVETGAVATSYIPTTTTSVTRSADALSWAFAAPSVGTVRAKVLGRYNSAVTFQFITSLHDGTASNRINLLSQGSKITTSGVSGGSVYWNFSGTSSPLDNQIHIAHARWSASLVDLYLDRTQEGTPDTSATIPTTTTLQCGADQSGGNIFNGIISDLRVYGRHTLR